jgi:hypothetical protein
LAAAMMAQFQGGTLDGAVVDEEGKAVADVQVLFFAPAPWGGKVQPVEVRARTDAGGQFRLTVPPLTGVYILRSRVWVYRAGSAITAVPVHSLSSALVLRSAKPRIIKIEGADGQPVAGAIVSPRVMSIGDGSTAADMPETLAAPLAVTTGPDGTATLTGLPSGDPLVAVRITADAIGTQDVQLSKQRGGGEKAATITIRLEQTSRLSGKVRTRTGQPVPKQAIEIWFKGSQWLEANPVAFKNGPLITAADGSFETPDNLRVGSSYRAVIRAAGMETMLSDWITMGEKPRTLLPMVQRPLRTISGRVVDRQAKAVAGIEVFQAGDGPERTATKTDADGRFALSGFCQGPVFLFARGEGFRFYGRLVKPGDGDIAVELTRTGERPAHPMRMLPDPIPLAESRALALRLLEPYWADFEKKAGPEKARALYALASVDPAGVLEKIDAVEFPDATLKSRTLGALARAISETDAEKVAMAADLIEEPAMRARLLVTVAGALPAEKRERKLSLLDRAALEAKASKSLSFSAFEMGEVAELLYDLGEKEMAKALFADGLIVANEAINKKNPWRGDFAARLARVNLPAALAIAKDYPAAGQDSQSPILGNIALHLARDNPAEAERILRQRPQETGREWLPSAVAWKMAMADPARARRLVDESQQQFDHPQAYLYLALGSKARDIAATQEAFQIAMRGIDRLMREGGEYSHMLGFRQVLLPIVEQIDPALVPEYFWRIVATRPSVGDPRSASNVSSGALVLLLAWYDRDVAVALFEPIRDQMERTDDMALARESTAFLSWSIFDPRAAAARLGKLPVNPRLDLNADHVRRQVCEYLRLSHDARWRKVWGNFTGMAEMIYPD